MEFRRRPATQRGSAEMFVGEVWIDEIAHGEEPSRIRVLEVHFAPGARTAWHRHTLGQTLYVTAGKGRIQSRGESVHELRAGDVTSTPAGEWHWHGAAPDHLMTHLSLTEGVSQGREESEWAEHVTDDEYLGEP